MSEYFQNAEIVVRQESNVIFEKTTQSEKRNDNEKTFNHKFSKNNSVDYTAFVEKKRARNKNLKVKRECQILLKEIKNCRSFFKMMKSACRSGVNATSFQ